MSTHEWKPWTILHEDCFLGESFEVYGDLNRYLEVCEHDNGTTLFTVREDEYPKGTTFDVMLTITPRPPKDTK
jgi:hypothetical protein